MNIKLTAVLPFLLVGSLQAQDRSAEIDFQNSLDSARTAAFARSLSAQRAEALRQARQTMICGGEESMRTSGYLQDEATPVEWAKQVPASVRKGGVIILSDALALDTLTLGPVLAGEAQALMDDAMPDCAEKAYFRRSVETRVWLELGGRRGPQAPAAYRLWLDNGAEMALDMIASQSKSEILPVLIDRQQAVVKMAAAAELPAARQRLEALEKANSRFAQFLQSESRWKQGNAERLR